MNEDARQRIQRKLEAEVDKTAAALLESEDAKAVSAGLQRIDACQKLLAAMPARSRREAARAAGVALICLSIAGLLWYLRLPRVHVTLDIASDTVAFQLTAPWEIDPPLEASQVRIENLESIRAPALQVDIDGGGGNAWIDLAGERIRLLRTRFAADGHLEIESVQHNLDLYFRNGALSAELTFQGAGILSAGARPADNVADRMPHDIQIPETIHLRGSSTGMIPTVLRIHPSGGWRLQDIRLRRLHFFREKSTAPGAVGFESAIRGGTVTIHETNASSTLREGDRMILEGVDGRLVRMDGSDGLRLTFEGSVEKLLIGPDGFERSLSPSLLEYLYVRKPIALFWSAVVFLWGLSWSILKVIRI